MQIIKKMELQNGGAAPPWRDTKRERANYSAANGTTRGGGSQPPVQTTWSRYAPWQAWQDDYVNIGKLQTQLGDALEEVRSYENYIKEVQIEVDEAQQHADEIQKKDVYGLSQQVADIRERIRWLKEDVANRVDEQCGKKNLVVLYTHNLEYEKSKLNKRIEEEQIGISQDRKNLEEEWKKR